MQVQSRQGFWNYALCISIYLHSSNTKPSKKRKKKQKTPSETKIVLLKLVQTDKTSGYIVNVSSISHL